MPASDPRSVDERTRRIVEDASRMVVAAATDPRQDAAAERAGASFDSRELAAFVNDGADKLQRR